MEAIELHRLIRIVRENEGQVLDLSTDAVICTFNYNLPFELDDKLNIKYALYSSISIPKDYYNEFIIYAYKTLGDYAKLSINCMIGMFKPKERENWRSLLVSSDPNTSFYHYLKRQAVFIDTRTINDIDYYQVFEKFI